MEDPGIDLSQFGHPGGPRTSVTIHKVQCVAEAGTELCVRKSSVRTLDQQASYPNRVALLLRVRRRRAGADLISWRSIIPRAREEPLGLAGAANGSQLRRVASTRVPSKLPARVIA